jgi:hypothetical protein
MFRVTRPGGFVLINVAAMDVLAPSMEPTVFSRSST